MANSLLDNLALQKKPKTNRNSNSDIFTAGKIITFRDSETSYRIIAVIDDEIQLIHMNINKIDIKMVRTTYLADLYNNYKIDVSESENIMVDTNKINKGTEERFNTSCKIAFEMEKTFSGDYSALKTAKGTSLVKSQHEKYNVSIAKIWKTYRIYLQSGFDKNALYDKRIFTRDYSNRQYHNKVGRKPSYSKMGKNLTEQDKKNMDTYIKKYKTRVFSSIPSCYKDMLAEYYTEYIKGDDGTTVPVLLPPNQLPTEAQFRYRLNNVLSKEEKSAIKAKRKDISQGNNSLNDADFLYDVHGPTTVVEMDEQEMDLSAVSYYDPSLGIGRFILHIIVDVQTKLVMAMSVSLDNNSVVGATHCLMNLADDHVEFCKRFGIEIKPEMWPSGYRIKILKTDRGSEYKSTEFERICNENQIDLRLTTARTASRKGTVEKQFSIFNSIWIDILSEYGTIRKLHDSNHHAKATLDYFAVMKICISNILAYNMKEIENYKRSREMIEEKVSTSPVNLWKYFENKYHTVHPIPNKNAFLYSLMSPTVCTINKEGVRWEGLWYQYNDNDIDEIRWLGKSTKMDVRIDKRDVSKLYYIKSNKLYIMTLNTKKTYNMDFENMPYEIYMKYREIQKQLEHSAREQNIPIDVINRTLVRNVLRENKRDTYANIEQMSLNRIAEKNLIKSGNALYDHLDMSDEKLQLVIETTEKNSKTKHIPENSSSTVNTDEGNWPSWDEISDEISDDEKDLIYD